MLSRFRFLLPFLAIPLLAPADSSDLLPDWKQYLWQDLSMLMEAPEKASFHSLQTREEQDEWFRRFWLRRDPTPTTEANERQEIHELRLSQARHHFAAKNPPGFDLRGRDLILFGTPDERIIHDDWFDETGYHNMRESWVWVDLDMRSEYEDRNLDGEYELATDALPSSRPDVSERYSKMFSEEGDDARNFLRELKLGNPDIYQQLVNKLAEGEITNLSELESEALTAELLGPKLEKMKGNYLETVKLGRDVYRHDFEAEALWAVFAVDNFRAPDGRTRVELSHEVRARDLRFNWDFERKLYIAKLLRSVVFYDEQDRPVSRSEEIIPIEAVDLDDARAATLLPGISSHILEAGRYRMSLRLEDLEGDRLQIFTTQIEVDDFREPGLTLSDVTFASLIEDIGRQGPFSKGDWWVKPHPLHSYGRDGRIQFFFEIYGLSQDEQGLSDYSVSYRIRRKNPELRSSWLWTREELVGSEVSATFLDRHGESVARHPLTLSAEGFEEAAYELEVEVRDRLSGVSARRMASFSVLPSGSLR